MGARASLAYLRRKMLEVTCVGSFYSFLPVLCQADPEQAGISLPCNAAEWARGLLPATACLGLCPQSKSIARVLGQPEETAPVLLSKPWRGGEQDSWLPLDAWLARLRP